MLSWPVESALGDDTLGDCVLLCCLFVVVCAYVMSVVTSKFAFCDVKWESVVSSSVLESMVGFCDVIGASSVVVSVVKTKNEVTLSGRIGYT